MVFEQRWHNDGMINMKTNHAFGTTVHHTHLLICIYIYLCVCALRLTSSFVIVTVRGLEKSKDFYRWCSESGVVDDMSESFPLTSSGKN